MQQLDTTLISDRVVAELRREILYGTLMPRQELYQDKLAQELGVSRMPVREALQVLANDGLVTVRPNKVAIVNEISEKFIRDFYDVRILLEVRAVRLACAHRPDCTAAWEDCEKADRTILAGDFAAYNVLNGAIHRFIWEAADNFKLRQILAQMWHTMDLDGRPMELARLSNADHRALIRCIGENDPDTAEAVMRQHIERSFQRVLQAIKERSAAK